MDAILFRKCLGLNDARAFGTQTMIVNPRDPKAGDVEFIDCLNVTTTSDGSVEKIAPFVTALTHSDTITNISAGTRFLIEDSTDIWEWTTDPAVINRFPLLNGPMVHTPIDCRVSSTTNVYRSKDNAPAVEEALRGIYPLPVTSKPYYGMPTFDQALVYYGRMYLINHGDPRFIQYSENFAYDVYHLADNFIGHKQDVIQIGTIPGVMVALHATGVSVYSGTGPSDFKKVFWPVTPISKTLFSGLVPKVYGYAHVFLCTDGVYMVGQDGQLKNLTVSQIDRVDILNASYTCATVQGGKYLAFGNSICLEYDFETKAVLKRSPFSVVGAAVWNSVNYYAAGDKVVTLGPDIDITDDFATLITLPFSDLGAPGKKIIESLYFTGTINGEMLITATDQTGVLWEREISEEWVNVSNRQIKTSRIFLGNHISFKIECTSGSFRLEELRAVFTTSNRSR